MTASSAVRRAGVLIVVLLVTASGGLVGGAASAQADPLVPLLPPPAVTGVSAAPGDSAATVAWDPSPLTLLVSSYTVTARPGGRTVTVTEPLADSAVVGGLTNGTSYTFTVTATNLLGTSPASAASNAVVPVAAAVLPDQVGGVTATPGNASAQVSWTRLADPDVTSYTVAAEPGGASVTVAASRSTVVVRGLTNGTAYRFTVLASNAVGPGRPSLPSEPVTPLGEPLLPVAPVSGVTAVAGDGSADVGWEPPPGAQLISGYTVTVLPGGETRDVAGGTSTTTRVDGLVNGRAYTFTVVAHRILDGASSEPSGPSAAVVPAGLPSAPGSVTVGRGDGRLVVTWSAADPNGSAVTGYRVTVGDRTRELPASARRAVLTGLANGRSYAASVTAANDVGTGAASAPTTATPAGRPGRVARPSAQVRGRTVVLTWRAPRANGAPVTGYRVTVNGRLRQVGSRRVVLRGARPGRYTFRVRARNAVGAGAASLPRTVTVRR